MGYTDASGTPSADLTQAIEHTDQSIQNILHELKAKGLASSTAIIITAKHGQMPMDVSKSRSWTIRSFQTYWTRLKKEW